MNVHSQHSVFQELDTGVNEGKHANVIVPQTRLTGSMVKKESGRFDKCVNGQMSWFGTTCGMRAASMQQRGLVLGAEHLGKVFWSDDSIHSL